MSALSSQHGIKNDPSGTWRNENQNQKSQNEIGVPVFHTAIEIYDKGKCNYFTIETKLFYMNFNDIPSKRFISFHTSSSVKLANGMDMEHSSDINESQNAEQVILGNYPVSAVLRNFTSTPRRCLKSKTPENKQMLAIFKP
ncbi:hypothetical protein ACNR90_001014 [Candidozyma auris]